MKRKRSYSLRATYMIVIALVVIGTVLLTFILNAAFLETYYYNEKKRTLIRAYEALDAASAEGTLAEMDENATFTRICERNNIDILVVDADSATIIASEDDPELLGRMWWNLFSRQNDATAELIEVITQNDRYVMQRIRNVRNNTHYIETWGVLQNDEMVLIITPIEAMRTAVQLANRYLLMVGLFTTVVGLVVAVVLSKKAAEPIRALTSISEQMKELNFESKYTSHGRREIDELGHNMNEVSETLERTLSDLKTANVELQRDIEEKTESERRQREFLANISHELKTPIALIRGYAEGLKEGVSDDEESRQYYCEVIEDEAGRMNEMVKRLMTLTQLESGEEPMVFERFDLAEMLQTFAKSADILTKSVSARVMMDVESPLYVWADQFAVEEVIQNYFQNAVHHVAGEKVIEIKAVTREDADKSRVRVSVFNTGDPIPEESVPQIWDKFYKVDKARTRAYGGSGVGLSIVKAIMESMHEAYGLTNYDNGVSFWFELEKA